MNTICGADCSKCSFAADCSGCAATNGHPLGGPCVVATCYQTGGMDCFEQFKNQTMDEFRALGIADLPEITDMFPLCGVVVNLEYGTANGSSIKLLDDRSIYLACQLQKPASERFYGLAADQNYLLVCEYGPQGSDPEIILYKKRTPGDKK